MHGEFPDFEGLYGKPASRELLRGAAIIEARGYGRWTRLREVAELSLLLGFRRLGIAHAPDTRWEAEKVAEAGAVVMRLAGELTEVLGGQAPGS